MNDEQYAEFPTVTSLTKALKTERELVGRLEEALRAIKRTGETERNPDIAVVLMLAFAAAALVGVEPPHEADSAGAADPRQGGTAATGWDALSDEMKTEWHRMVAEMRDPATKPCGCGYPKQECLRVVLRNGPPFPPRPCEPNTR